MRVTIYTTGDSCPQCGLTKRVMRDTGISFDDVDLTDDANAAARAYVTELGYTQAPVVVIDDHDHWSGFQPDEIKRVAAAVRSNQ